MERHRHAAPVLSGAYLCRGDACVALCVKTSRLAIGLTTTLIPIGSGPSRWRGQFGIENLLSCHQERNVLGNKNLLEFGAWN